MQKDSLAMIPQFLNVFRIVKAKMDFHKFFWLLVQNQQIYMAWGDHLWRWDGECPIFQKYSVGWKEPFS